MKNKLYVGNLDYNLGEKEIEDIFSKYGDVEEVKLIINRQTNQSKGFAFVTMGTEESAEKAMSELNLKEIDGRTIKVSEAKERSNNNNNRRNNNRNFNNRW